MRHGIGERSLFHVKLSQRAHAARPTPVRREALVQATRVAGNGFRLRAFTSDMAQPLYGDYGRLPPHRPRVPL